jgi:hypothetical protein
MVRTERILSGSWKQPRSNLRIPDEADQRSGVMSITIPG